MHPKIAEAFQQIDAALFNSDTFEYPEAKKELKFYLKRWKTKLKEVEDDQESEA